MLVSPVFKAGVEARLARVLDSRLAALVVRAPRARETFVLCVAELFGLRFVL
jgi:hypothetical protein